MSTGIKLGECPVSGGRRSDMMTPRNMRGAAADIYPIFRLNKNNAIYTRVSVVPDEWSMITIQEINVSCNRGAVLWVVRFRSVSVSTVTKYNMNGLSINVRFAAGGEMFQFINTADRLWSELVSYPMDSLSGRGVMLSTHTHLVPKVKNHWSCASI